MSLAAAHRFIAAARADASLRDRIAALGPDPHIDQLVAIAASAGFAFDAAALRAAFAQDWTLRGIAAAGSNG